MFYCGIDPGKDGGVAIIDSNKMIHFITKYDDRRFADLLFKRCLDLDMKICIEDVHAIEHASAGSTFSFGRNVGKAVGIIVAYNAFKLDGRKGEVLPETVRPQKWKEEFGLIYGRDFDKEAKKQASIDKAKELFNNIILKAGPRTQKEHDGMAEALLIAEWYRRQNEAEYITEFDDRVPIEVYEN